MGGLFGAAPDIFGEQGLLGMLGLAGKPKQQPGMMGGQMPVMPSGQALMQGAQVPQMPQQQMPQQAKKPGFNEPGGIGDTLKGIGAIWQDNPAAYNQILQNRQQAHHAQQQAMAQQQQQEAENAQWYERENWKRDNPAPVNNDTINDVNWYKGATDEDKRIYDMLHPIYKTGPDGLPYPVARGTGMLPTAPVGKLTPMGGTAPSGQVPLLPRR